MIDKTFKRRACVWRAKRRNAKAWHAWANSVKRLMVRMSAMASMPVPVTHSGDG